MKWKLVQSSTVKILVLLWVLLMLKNFKKLSEFHLNLSFLLRMQLLKFAFSLSFKFPIFCSPDDIIENCHQSPFNIHSANKKLKRKICATHQPLYHTKIKILVVLKTTYNHFLWMNYFNFTLMIWNGFSFVGKKSLVKR